MGFNYGYETKKFNQRWDVLSREYADAGMCEADIQTIRDFDWEQLKSERRYQMHTQPIDGAFTDGTEAGEEQSPLLKKYAAQLSVEQPEIREWGRYDWIEDIGTSEVGAWLKSLPEVDLEVLTSLVMGDMSRADLSREMGISRAAVTKRMNRLKYNLQKILAEG